MRKLEFPSEIELYTKNDSGEYRCLPEFFVAPFELLWILVDTSPLKDFKKKDNRNLSRLKSNLRAISQVKDKDQDSRILNPGTQTLLLEEDQYDLLNKLIELNPVANSKANDAFCALLDVLESAKEFTPQELLKQKPQLVE